MIKHTPSFTPHAIRRTGMGLLAAILSVAVLLPAVSRAATYTWSGSASPGNTNWMKNTNWFGNNNPNTNNSLVFTGTRTANNNNNPTSFTATGITFNAAAGAFNLSGNAINVGTGGIVNSSANTQTLSFGTTGITLSGTQAWNGGSAGIVAGSKVNLNGNGLSLLGNMTMNGKISGSDALSSPSVIVGDIAGDSANVIFNVNNDIGPSGDGFSVALVSGTLTVNTNGALGSGSFGIVSLTGTATLASGSNGINIGNNMLVESSFNVAASTAVSGGMLTVSGAVDLDTTFTSAITITALNGNTLKFTGGITQSTGTASLTLNGGGVGGDFLFAGSTANTYTGLTTVTNGATLTLNDSATNGAIAGDLQIDANSTVKLNNPDQIADTSKVTVNGTFNLDGNNETIGSLSGSTGLVRLNGATITMGSASGTYSGQIRDNGAAGSLVMNGTGTQILSSSNHYTGGTTLNAGTLLADDDNALGSGTLTINNTGAGATLGSGSNGSVHLVNDVDALTSFSVAPASLTSGTMSLYGLLTLDTSGSTANFTITQTNGNVFRFFGGIGQSGTGVASLTFDGGGPGVQGIFRIGDSTAASTYGGLTTVTDYATLILNNGGTNIAIPGNLQIDANSTVRYVSHSDQIADTATVTDNGMLDLNGNNETFATLLGSGTVKLSGGTFTVGSGSFSGGIKNGGSPGTLIKTGVGTLFLSGFNSNSGTTNIDGGMLVLDGTLSSLTNVNPGSTLSGTGFIANSVTNASLIRPGDASGPGVLTAKVNYTQTSSGTLTLRVGGTGAGQHDLLQNQGTASLNGTLDLVRLNNYTGKLGDKIQLLVSPAVSGTFVNVINPFTTNTLVMADIVYDANDVFLSFDQGSFAAFAAQQGLTPNEFSVAQDLDKAAGDARATALITFLDNEPLGNLKGDFDLISPEELTALFDISRSYADVQAANIEQRLAEDRAETAPQGVAVGLMVGDGKSSVDKDVTTAEAAREKRWSFFMEGSGEFVHANGDTNAAGYDFTTAGVTLGGDYRVNDHLVVGLMAGYANTGSTLVNNGSVDVNGGKLGVFSTYYTHGFYVNALAAGGYNSYDTHRLGLGGIAQGSTDGEEFDGLLGTGYDLCQGQGGVTFGPVANVQYTHVGLNGFTEFGSLAPLNIVSQSQESLRTKAGFHLAYEAKFGGITVTPGVTAGWQHEYLNSSYALDSQFANGAGGIFQVNGPALGRDSVVVNAGVSVQWTPRVGSYLYYDGELGRKNYELNSVTGGVRVSF